MADNDEIMGDGPKGSVYRVAGALTIMRAATTQRELDALPDPLTIDLTKIERMDTVGAWIVYRSVRDRQAKVIGASDGEQACSRKWRTATSRPRSMRKRPAGCSVCSASSDSGLPRPVPRWLACSVFWAGR